MGLCPVPYDLLDEGADSCAFLFYRHSVYAVFEGGKELRQQIILNIGQGMAGGQFLELVQMPL